jgi:hypothetical protein
VAEFCTRAVVAASSYLAGGSAADYHRRMRRDIARQIGRASQLYRLGSSATGKAVMMRMVATWPSALHLAARLTRIPHCAMSDALEACRGRLRPRCAGREHDDEQHKGWEPRVQRGASSPIGADDYSAACHNG